MSVDRVESDWRDFDVAACLERRDDIYQTAQKIEERCDAADRAVVSVGGGHVSVANSSEVKPSDHEQALRAAEHAAREMQSALQSAKAEYEARQKELREVKQQYQDVCDQISQRYRDLDDAKKSRKNLRVVLLVIGGLITLIVLGTMLDSAP